MILRGKSRSDCLKFIAAESKRLGFENTESHCSNIYAQVRTAIKAEIAEIREDLENDIVAKLYDLYEKSYGKEDYRECREILTAISKTLGMGNSVTVANQDQVINIQFA